jgi:hypothetical protein
MSLDPCTRSVTGPAGNLDMTNTPRRPAQRRTRASQRRLWLRQQAASHRRSPCRRSSRTRSMLASPATDPAFPPVPRLKESVRTTSDRRQRPVVTRRATWSESRRQSSAVGIRDCTWMIEVGLVESADAAEDTGVSDQNLRTGDSASCGVHDVTSERPPAVYGDRPNVGALPRVDAKHRACSRPRSHAH